MTRFSFSMMRIEHSSNYDILWSLTFRIRFQMKMQKNFFRESNGQTWFEIPIRPIRISHFHEIVSSETNILVVCTWCFRKNRQNEFRQRFHGKTWFFCVVCFINAIIITHFLFIFHCIRYLRILYLSMNETSSSDFSRIDHSWNSCHIAHTWNCLCQCVHFQHDISIATLD